MMYIELAIMVICFMLVGFYVGRQLGKARGNVQIQLPEWLTYTFDIFKR